MKNPLIIALAIFALPVFGQKDYSTTIFGHLTEVRGTDYVIASNRIKHKIAESSNEYLLFINTKDGTTTRVDIESGYLEQLEQVKIDSLAINTIVIAAKTVDANNKKGIDWSDPQQIFILSTDGKSLKQLTENNFYATRWAVNKQTGRIVITGHYDSNNNGKYDKADQNEILIFDLKTLELIAKI
jgi:hypothetical protein